MRSLLVLLVLASQLAGAGSALGQAPVRALPDVIPLPPEGGSDNTTAPPIWIAATAAADRDHVLKYDAIGETTEKGYLHNLVGSLATGLGTDTPRDTKVAEVKASECPSYTVSSQFGHLVAPGSETGNLASLVDSSIGVYVGTVTARTPGFSSANPNTIASVSITKTLRGATAVPLSSLYLLSPISHFRIGAYIFCSQYMGAPEDLQVGDQVLVFVYRWIKGGVPLTAPNADQLMVLSKQGLRLGPGLSADARLQGKSFDAALDIVNQALAKKAVRP